MEASPIAGAYADGALIADGVIAVEIAWLGAETFVSFNKRAVQRLEARGESARLLS